MEVGYAQTTHLVSLLTWVHHGKFHMNLNAKIGVHNFRRFFSPYTDTKPLMYLCYFRLHGVCNENPLAPLIGRLGLPLYRTSGDNSVLYDHDLER